MPSIFNYRARDRSRANSSRDTVEAGDRAAAIQLIEQKRCVPFKIEAGGSDNKAHGSAGVRQRQPVKSRETPSGGTPRGISRIFFSRKPKPSSRWLCVATGAAAASRTGSVCFFTEQLAYLLSAGHDARRSSRHAWSSGSNSPRSNRLTAGLHQSLIDGRSFSQALRDYPTHLFVLCMSTWSWPERPAAR